MGIFSKLTGALETSLGLSKPERIPQKQAPKTESKPQTAEQTITQLLLHPPSNFVSLAELGLKPADAKKAKDIHWQITEQKVRQSFPDGAERILEMIKNSDEMKAIEAFAAAPIPYYDGLFNNLQLASPENLIKKVSQQLARQEAQAAKQDIAELRTRIAMKGSVKPKITQAQLEEAQEFMQVVGQGEEVYSKQGTVTGGEWPQESTTKEVAAQRESTIGSGEFESARRRSSFPQEEITEAGGLIDLNKLMQEGRSSAKEKR